MNAPAYIDDAPEGLAPTVFQQASLALRGHYNVLDAGGRGGGKSHAFCLSVLAYCNELSSEARPLVTREQHGALVELQSKLFELSLMVTNGRASRNKSDMTITWPTGAQIQFTNITDEQSYARHQGRSYTGLFGDEVGNYPPSAFTPLQHLRSNLRVRPGHQA